ncbi:uncharacterized protein LOC128191214 [Crassostrea angulata]|uniref:Uncharacterized protein n=2 Tax=Magallana gigas TaxID=29159 RepID=A0A8W8LGJ3_MAGGI|nr:uncharacterized protein LOC105337550 [Crassostrea gigas]XP_052719262.1 uncharacterized protein LOC128191214 [Crassostrea angulata]
MAVLVWAVILVSGILGSQGEAIKKQAPLVCYRCDKVADAVDCTVTEACNSDEQCFTDKYISEEGNVYFTLGCKAKRICDILASFGKREVEEDMTDREKRNIIHLCTQCCASGYCNNKLCTVVTTPVPTRKCQVCTQLEEDPLSCTQIQNCEPHQECYADVVMDQNHQVRHRMGCRSKVMCEAFLHHGHGLSHGRRAVGIGNDAHVAQLCGGCCNSDACNRGGCYTISHYNLTNHG